MPFGWWALYGILSGAFTIGRAALAATAVVVFIVLALPLWRGRKEIPKAFDHNGVTLRGGKTFAWSELESVEHQYFMSHFPPYEKAMWRVEIQFRCGKISLLPVSIGNFAEVYRFVSNLPCRQTEKTFDRGTV